MPQVLKDTVRDAILDAALQEFWACGYRAATMRGIAQRAQVPASLIYTYYQNKAALFDAVVRPALWDWERVLSAPETGHPGTGRWLSQAETEVLLALLEHRQASIILFEKSAGTRYEGERARLVGAIEAHLDRHKRDTGTDAVFVHILANNFVDALIQILYHYKGKEWALAMLHKLSQMYCSGIGL